MILVFSDQRRDFTTESRDQNNPGSCTALMAASFCASRASLATNKALSSQDETSSCSFEWICDMRSEGLPSAYLGKGRAGQGEEGSVWLEGTSGHS